MPCVPAITLEEHAGRAKILVGLGGERYPISAELPLPVAQECAAWLQAAVRLVGSSEVAQSRKCQGRLPAPSAAERAIVDDIVVRVAATHGVTPGQIESRSREAHVARARHAVWAELRASGWSFPRIGRATGYDHSTVMNGVRKAGG